MFDMEEFTKCHALEWDDDIVMNYIYALEDFDDSSLECSSNYAKYVLASFLFLLVLF